MLIQYSWFIFVKGYILFPASFRFVICILYVPWNARMGNWAIWWSRPFT